MKIEITLLKQPKKENLVEKVSATPKIIKVAFKFSK